jgi:hypothetical protein
MFRSALSKIVVAAFAMVSTAQAQQAYWKKQDIKVQFNGTSSSSSYTGIFQLVKMKTVAYECGYTQDPVVEVRPGTCYDTTCSQGAGKSPAWDAFYGAKKAEKASRLAGAVRGIGKSSAESLVNAGYFSSKPRSWDAFKSEINSAAAAGVISNDVKVLVLSTYRRDNMANLGYSAGSCQTTTYACNEVRVIQEGGYVSQTCVDNVEEVVLSKPVNYVFNVTGANLLPHETETIVVTASGEPHETFVKSSAYNAYAYQLSQNGSNNATLTLQATGRKQVDLPYTGFQSATLTPNGPNKANLQVVVSPSILPASGTETLAIRYEVRSCQAGMLNFCVGGGWAKRETFNGTITSNVSAIDIPVTLPESRKGTKVEVEVSVYKQNSIFHNASPLTKTTQKIIVK